MAPSTSANSRLLSLQRPFQGPAGVRRRIALARSSITRRINEPLAGCLWRAWPKLPAGDSLIFHESYRPMQGLAEWLTSRRTVDPRVVESILSFETHTHERWLYDLHGPIYIEPTAGNVFREGRVLSRATSYPHMAARLNSQLIGKILRPGRHNRGELDVAVSFRDRFNEGNFWHFIDDLLPKLGFLKTLSLPSSTPLLVGPRLWYTRFLQEAIALPELRSYRWTLHDALLRVNRLIVGHNGSLRSTNLQLARAYLGNGSLPDDRGANAGDRIFLRRDPQRGRYLANEDAVIKVLRDYDFRVVDADVLSLSQQVRLFAGARYVVGIHGAGLTNLAHRLGSAALLEMFPADYIHPHYAWLCRALDYDYDAVVGSSMAEGAFSVDLGTLHAAVQRLLPQ